MREIKFRAWDQDDKKMLMVITLNDFMENIGFEYGFTGPIKDYVSYEQLESKKRLIWLQYTGLNDKNGKEIYEGNLVKVSRKTWLVVSTNLSDLTLARPRKKTGSDFPTRKDGYVHRGYQWLKSHLKRGGVEIIGNIYQHEHLLK